MIMIPKTCASCKHFPDDPFVPINRQYGKPIEVEDQFMLVCPAFPNGIPEDILEGKNPHHERHPDQTNEIVWEKREKTS